MATKKETLPFTYINLSNCVIIPDENTGRMANGLGTPVDRLALAELFVRDGFKADLSIPVVRLLKPNEKEAAKLAFEATVASFAKDGSFTLEYDGQEDKKMKTVVFCEEIHKYLQSLTFEPVYAIVAGNRRFDCLPIINGFLLKQNKEAMQFPAEVRAYASEQERMVDVIYENGHRHAGMLDMSWKDMLLAARKMLANGCKQIDLRRAFKDGMGQKLYSMLQLENEMVARAGKNYIDEILKKKEFNFGRIRASKVNEQLESLAKAGNAKECKSVAKDAVDYIYNRVENPASTKMMKKDDIAAFKKSPIVIVRRLIEGILSNDKSCMASFVPLAKNLNDACKSVIPEDLQIEETE